MLGGLTGREGERGLIGRTLVGGETGGLTGGFTAGGSIGGETGGLTGGLTASGSMGGETGRPVGAEISAGRSRVTPEGNVNAAKVETGDQVEDTAEELCEAEQLGAVMFSPE